ncbi:MAG: bifunctional riboflavin kinase/FAD synthetase, partial [Pseudomonadota bacterium]
MICVHGVEALETPFSTSAVSIGNFDGLHKGHRVLIRQLLDSSQRLGVPPIVFTFHPHPLKVISPEKDLRRLFLVDDLVEQLEKEGVEALILQPFSREFSQISPEQYLQKYLVSPLSPKALVVGHDFGFGAKRSGSVSTLESFCQRESIELNVIAPVSFDEETVSSSRIRNEISSGNVGAASRLLGRDFYIKGVVEYGDGRGSKIGFPTANVRLYSETLPKAGVYITSTLVDGVLEPSVTNIGKNPTFLEHKTSAPMRVETHLLNFDKKIYGHEVRVFFHKFLRDEQKFASVDDLIAQIRKDAESARGFHSAKASG